MGFLLAIRMEGEGDHRQYESDLAAGLVDTLK
jgi:hypothetical protein